jgi:hypothetical protein
LKYLMPSEYYLSQLSLCRSGCYLSVRQRMITELLLVSHTQLLCGGFIFM